jgi:hypothetical protein
VADLRALKYAPNRRECLACIASRLEPGGVLIALLPREREDDTSLDDLLASGFRPVSAETRTYDQHGVVHDFGLLTAGLDAGALTSASMQAERRSRPGPLLGSLGLLCRHRPGHGWSIAWPMPGSFTERAGTMPGQRLRSVCGVQPDALDPDVLQATFQAGRAIDIEIAPPEGTVPR